jgi:CheY-like chemotaxis protein
MKQASRSQAGVSRGSRRAKRTLLVLHVNDSTDDQVLFQTACKHAKVPFLWHVADSAEKALSYFRALLEVNRQHAVRWPDLVLLDIVMPGDSGLRVLEYVRATPDLKALPVVILTSEDEPKLIRKAQELGANSYLLKPKQFHETVQLVGALYATWSRARRPAAAADAGLGVGLDRGSPDTGSSPHQEGRGSAGRSPKAEI